MKKTVILLLLMCGCQTSKLKIGDNQYEGRSFLVLRKIVSVTLTTETNGVKTTFALKGYGTKDSELAGSIAEGVARGLK